MTNVDLNIDTHVMDSDILFFHYIQDDVNRPPSVPFYKTTSGKILHHFFTNSCTIIRNIPFTYVYYCGPPEFRTKSNKQQKTSDK